MKEEKTYPSPTGGGDGASDSAGGITWIGVVLLKLHPVPGTGLPGSWVKSD